MGKTIFSVCIDADIASSVQKIVEQSKVSRSKAINDLMNMLVQLNEGNIKSIEGVNVLLHKYISPRSK